MNPGQGKNLGQEDFDGSGKKKSEQRRKQNPYFITSQGEDTTHAVDGCSTGY